MSYQSHPSSLLSVTLASSLVALVTLSACEAPPPEPSKSSVREAQASQATAEKTASPAPVRPAPPAKKKVVAKPTASVTPTPDDPLKGVFSVADATAGLPPGKDLVATIETDGGTLKCTLYPDKAPITVANFVGLARGLRPFKGADGKWEKKPAYDGTIFHRVVKGFMIQGGEIVKGGRNGSGYVIPDEVWEDATHDRPGLLCMANRGPNTNSDQFFIMDGAAFHLDNGYTIFGECGPVDVVHALANVPVKGDQSVTPTVIKKVSVGRP